MFFKDYIELVKDYNRNFPIKSIKETIKDIKTAMDIDYNDESLKNVTFFWKIRNRVHNIYCMIEMDTYFGHYVLTFFTHLNSEIKRNFVMTRSRIKEAIKDYTFNPSYSFFIEWDMYKNKEMKVHDAKKFEKKLKRYQKYAKRHNLNLEEIRKQNSEKDFFNLEDLFAENNIKFS